MKRRVDWFLRSHGAAILHEDDHLLVVDKPSGLLVLPDRYDRSLENLYEGLRSELGEIFVVHRIDRETSGVLVFAKTPEAHAQLSELFQARAVEKTYVAIVRGLPQTPEGEIHADVPVRRDGSVVDRAAHSRYRVREAFRWHSLVEVKPITGRTHQIRIHLQSIGLPIVGDRLHGDGRPFYLSEIKPSYKPGPEGEKPLLDRAALHAAELRCSHPVTRQLLVLRSEFPKDMRSVLHALRKYSAL
jgi:23S rRNA pseudouridine1911/1915/1917 synthase